MKIIAELSLALLLLSSSAFADKNNFSTNNIFLAANSVTSSKPAVLKASTPAAWKSIQHIVIIIFENTSAQEAVKQPFMKSLLEKGAYLSQYFAITHPSQPNYIAMVAGSTYDVTSDESVIVDARHLGDLLNSKGKTWKAYAEDLPTTPCFLGARSNDYARKHEPFISFRSVEGNPTECSKIVPASQFFTDLSNKQLPTFSLYIPNQKNDGHDTGVTFADAWLAKTFGKILKDEKVLKHTLFIITFDEDDYSENNKIYTAFVGAGVKKGASSNAHYNHYNLLRTIEEILQLDSLELNDKASLPIKGIWK